MEEVTYSKINLKKSQGNSSKLDEEESLTVYVDIRRKDTKPDVEKKPFTRCSGKVISISINVLLVCALAFMVFYHVSDGKQRNEQHQEPQKQLSMNMGSGNTAVCKAQDDQISKVKQLCVNSSDSASGCRLCPPDWRLHGDYCYYYSDVSERTWDQSRDHCEMMGADLPVIKDQQQQEFIQRILSDQRGGDTYWMGLHHDEDGWRWVDGEQYNSSSLFHIVTSSSSSGRCVYMSRSHYYQGKCDKKNRWICVREAVRI